MGIALSLLREDERGRLGRFRSALHRSRYARGRAFLRRELAKWTATAPGDIELRPGVNGKPMLEGGPHFNLSHSEGLAVLAISQDAPVGIDLEMATQHIGVDHLASECLDPEESGVLHALSGAARTQRFLAFWTAKEARMKLTGEGMSLAPSRIRLRLEEGWPVRIAAPADPPTLLWRPALGIRDAVCTVATLADG